MALNVSNASDVISVQEFERPAGLTAIVIISILFTVIFIAGIVGNSLVILVIMVDRKMRNSATNIFILNLAVADFLLTVFSVTDIIQFIIDKGWILGLTACRFNRFIMNTSLFASIMTLVSVCVERYIAIVHPIKAHIFCEKKKVLLTISAIWPLSLIADCYIPMYNNLLAFKPGYLLCVTHFPGDNPPDFYKSRQVGYYEMVVFYFVPVITQIILYSIISYNLFKGAQELFVGGATNSSQNGGLSKPRLHRQPSETLKARRGVVMMLIACVVVYIISYSPPQFLLLYKTFAGKAIHQTWVAHVVVMAMAQINSAANPILYCVISQKFRRNFQRYLCAICRVRDRVTTDSFDSRTSGKRSGITKTAVSTV